MVRMPGKPYELIWAHSSCYSCRFMYYVFQCNLYIYPVSWLVEIKLFRKLWFKNIKWTLPLEWNRIHLLLIDMMNEQLFLTLWPWIIKLWLLSSLLSEQNYFYKRTTEPRKSHIDQYIMKIISFPESCASNITQLPHVMNRLHMGSVSINYYY